MLWDLNEAKHLYSLEAGDVVNALVFSPNRYWLCAATASCIKIFDLESKCVESRSRNLAVTLMLVVSSGRLSMNSSQNGPTPARSRNQYVCRSLGHRMARHCSVVSPMTLFVSGALSRNYFVELVVYCVTCCTHKIARCCIHVLSLHCKCMMRRSGTKHGRASFVAVMTLTTGGLTFLACKSYLCFHCLLEITNTLLVRILVHSTEVYRDGSIRNVDLQLADV